MSKTTHRIAFLDTIRGFAALWVVLFHCAEGKHLPMLLGALPDWLADAVFFAGHLGVPIFFVLSGFVLARISAGKIDSWRAVMRFLAQRLVRLSPPYYLAVLIGFGQVVVKGQVASAPLTQAFQVVAHLAYCQDILGVDPLNTIFWTLAIEVQFYIAFALLLWAAHALTKGARAPASASWFVGAAAVGALLWPLHVIEGSLWRGGFLALWYSFLCGSLVALSRGGARGRELVALAYIAAVGLLGAWLHDSFALATAIAALFVFVAERWAALASAVSLGPLRSLGLVSYSLYLFHNPVTGVVARIVRRAMPAGLASDIVVLVAVLTACVLFAGLMYALIEKPAIRWSHRFAR